MNPDSKIYKTNRFLLNISNAVNSEVFEKVEKTKQQKFGRLPKKLSLRKEKTKNRLSLGQFLTIRISSQAPNSLGIFQFSDGFTVLVPNTQLGDYVQVKIVKKTKKLAFAKVIEILQKAKPNLNRPRIGATVNVKIVSIKDFILVGVLAEDENIEKDIKTNNKKIPYFFIIRFFSNSKKKIQKGDKLPITVTRLKTKYGFGQLFEDEQALESSDSSSDFTNLIQKKGIKSSISSINKIVPFNPMIFHLRPQNKMEQQFVVSNLIDSKIVQTKRTIDNGAYKLNLRLPNKFTSFGNIVGTSSYLKSKNLTGLPLEPVTFFITGRNLKSKASTLLSTQHFSIPEIKSVDSSSLFSNLLLEKTSHSLKISQLYQTSSGELYSFAKILKKKTKPIAKKNLEIKQNIEQMLKTGMHFGEKAVQCHAKMRQYIWIRQKGQNKNRPLIKKKRHFLNLLKTRRCLKKVSSVIAKYALKGRTFLFIGTKKSAASLISRAAFFCQKSFFVNTRWLGGMLTNWKTILKSISKIRPILKEKQKRIQLILEKRQGIKRRLMKKITTSLKYYQKGGDFLETIKKKPDSLVKRNNAYTAKRKDLLKKGLQLLKKRRDLLKKRQNLFQQSQILKEKGAQILAKYQRTLGQITTQKQKLKELRNQALLCQEMKKLKKKSSFRFDELTNNQSVVQNLLDDPSSLLAILKGKLGNFSLDILTGIKAILKTLRQLIVLLVQQKEAFQQIQNQITSFLNKKKKIQTELRFIKTKLVSEEKILKILTKKRKRAYAEKRFFKFLLECKKLAVKSTLDFEKSQAKSVQILMQKLVDPKLKQAASSFQIYDEKLKKKSKKIAAAEKKKWLQLEKYFGGMANMFKMNKKKISKNVAIIIGQEEEMNAVRECQKLGIEMFQIVDTNNNPTLANHFIPANDDSRDSIRFILTKLLKRIRLAQKLRLRLWKSTFFKTKKKSRVSK
jgi:small subunit ribosomal protein S2